MEWGVASAKSRAGTRTGGRGGPRTGNSYLEERRHGRAGHDGGRAGRGQGRSSGGETVDGQGEGGRGEAKARRGETDQCDFGADAWREPHLFGSRRHMPQWVYSPI